MVDTTGVEAARATNHAVHFVTFLEKELREVATILQRNLLDSDDLAVGCLPDR